MKWYLFHITFRECVNDKQTEIQTREKIHEKRSKEQGKCNALLLHLVNDKSLQTRKDRQEVNRQTDVGTHANRWNGR